jgi:hypothetical protein
MSEYNPDQWEALLMVQRYLEGLPASMPWRVLKRTRSFGEMLANTDSS